MVNLYHTRSAVEDVALYDRLVSAAYVRGVDSPREWVASRIGKLVTAALPTNAQGQSIADVHGYGSAQKVEQESARTAYFAKAPAVVEPSDPTYLPDSYLLEAVSIVLDTPDQ